MSEPVTLEVLILHSTEKAVLVDHDGEEKWIPKSIIEEREELDYQEHITEQEITVPWWFAYDEGLI